MKMFTSYLIPITLILILCIGISLFYTLHNPLWLGLSFMIYYILLLINALLNETRVTIPYGHHILLDKHKYNVIMFGLLSGIILFMIWSFMNELDPVIPVTVSSAYLVPLLYVEKLERKEDKQ